LSGEQLLELVQQEQLELGLDLPLRTLKHGTSAELKPPKYVYLK
jgi:hypothetical protein